MSHANAGKLLVVGALVMLGTILTRATPAFADSTHNNKHEGYSHQIHEHESDDEQGDDTDHQKHEHPSHDESDNNTDNTNTDHQNHHNGKDNKDDVTVAPPTVTPGDCAVVLVNGCHNSDHETTPCVDGTDKNNLVVTWIGTNSATITTKNNAPLCNDVTVYLSDYIVRGNNYDGTGFDNNPTAYPQDLYQSISAVLKKGTNGCITMTVTLPDPCKDYQVDVYYTPEITLVGAAGHAGQFISGGIYQGVGTCEVKPPCHHEPPVTPPCPPQTPGKGADTPPVVTPPATTAVAVTPAVAAPVVAVLTDTGLNLRAPSIIAAFTLALGIFVGTRRTKTEA